MTYKEILNYLKLECDKYKDDPLFKEFFNDTFIKTLNDFFSLFNEANYININEKDNYILKEKRNIFNYHYNIKQLDTSHNKEIDLLKEVKKNNEENVYKDLEMEARNYNSRKELNRESLRHNLANINKSIITKKETIQNDNEILDNSKTPNLENYNKYIDRFKDIYNEKYQQIHSKISKEQYNLKDANQNVVAHLKKQYNETSKHINSINKLTEKEKEKLEKDLFDYEVKLNETINKITEKYQAIKKQNEVQTSVEIDDIKKKIENIEKNYTSTIKKINQNASKRLNTIDKFNEDDGKKLSQKIMDERYLFNVQNIQNEEQIAKAYKDLEGLSFREKIKKKRIIRLEEKQIKIKTSIKLASIKQDEISLKRLNAINMYQKALIDAERKYQMQIKTLDENKERYPLLKKIRLSEDEKQGFNTLLDNLLNKDINNEKLQTDILKLNKESNFNIFEARQQIELANLTEEAEDFELDEKLSEKVLEIILNNNQEKDDLAYKHYSNISMLNIEKNKHLNHLNTVSANFHKELNNLYLKHYEDLKNLSQDRYIKINQENTRYDEESLKIYKELKNNELNKISTEYKYENSLCDSLLYFKKVTEKYKIQERRRLESVELIQIELNEFTLIIKNIKEIYNAQFFKVIEKIMEDKNNINSYLKYIANMRFGISNILNAFYLNITKLIDTYVRLDTGSKYDTLRNNIEFTYQSRLDGISKEIEQLQSTIANYQNGISSFFKYIAEINVLITGNLKVYPNKSKAEKKEIRKANLKYKDEIKNWKNKINQNASKIESLTKSIKALNLRLESYKKIRYRKLNKVKILERKDSIVSISTSEKLKRITNYYLELMNENNTNQLLSQILYNDPNKKKYQVFKIKLDKTFNDILFDYKHIINSYLTNLLISLNKIKNKNTRTYNNAKSNLIAQRQADFNLIEKENKNLEKEFNSAFENHNKNIADINNKYNSDKLKEQTEYEVARANILSKFNNKINYYYNLFNSCDDLILYSAKDYNSSLKQLDDYQTNETKNVLVEISKIKKKNRTIRKNDNEKYHNEVTIIPKYTSIKTKELVSKVKEINASLDNQNSFIKKTLKNLAKNSKIDIEKYYIQIHKEKKNEFLKFRRTCKDLKKENINQLYQIEKNMHKEKGLF